MDPRIADYIRENRRRYTREALTKQLIAAGHDPGEIEGVWAALDSRDADDVAGEGFWGRFALILVGINLAVFLGVALLTGMFANLPSSGVILVILGIAMAIGALIAWGIVAATGPTKLSPRTALVIGAAIPALFALLIGGSCYALIGGLGGISGPTGPAGPPPANGAMQLRISPPMEHLSQEMSATCQAGGPNPSDGFFVFAYVEFGDRPPMDVSVSAHPEGPGGELTPMVFLSFQPMVEKAGPEGWGNEFGSGGTTELDPGSTAQSGTVRFEGLPGSGPGGTGDAEPLSGEISWTCE